MNDVQRYYEEQTNLLRRKARRDAKAMIAVGSFLAVAGAVVSSVTAYHCIRGLAVGDRSPLLSIVGLVTSAVAVIAVEAIAICVREAIGILKAKP